VQYPVIPDAVLAGLGSEPADVVVLPGTATGNGQVSGPDPASLKQLVSQARAVLALGDGVGLAGQARRCRERAAGRADRRRPSRAHGAARRDPRHHLGRVMTIIRTVTGDITPDEVGITLTHEHML
jgi:hypothetical protein